MDQATTGIAITMSKGVFILRSRLGHFVRHTIIEQNGPNTYTLGLNSLTRVEVDNKNRVYLVGSSLTYDEQRNRWRTGYYHAYDFPKLLGTLDRIEKENTINDSIYDDLDTRILFESRRVNGPA